MVTWVKQKEQIPDEPFVEIEERLGIKFPQDYIHWVQQYAAPESGQAHILINGEPYHFDELYPPDMINDEIEALYDREEEYKAKGLIVPFAFDSALNRYCFFYGQDKNHPLIFWAHKDDTLSEIFDGDELSDRVPVFRSSFTEFIRALYIRSDW